MKIISLTLAVWSVAVAATSLARSFYQLLLTRVSVAVGEAGCYPPALSLISDYFERPERPRAVARFMLGIPLALGIGYFAAGWLDQFFGWRVTFLFLGVPGALLAALAALTLNEPRRRADALDHDTETQHGRAPNLGLSEVLLTLWRSNAYRHMFLSFSVWGFFGYGIQQWMPAFFMRSFSVRSGTLGTGLALVNGAVGLAATYVGGEMAARYAVNNERLQLVSIAAVYAALAVIFAAMFLAPTYAIALTLAGVYAMVASAVNGPLFAATQTLVPARMRAMSISLMYFFCNLIGMGLGPLAVGALSDFLRPRLGAESLRYALLAFCPGYFWCAWHYWQASKTVALDIANAELCSGTSEAFEPLGLGDERG